MSKTTSSDSQLPFSKKFLWGASVSTHQVEGNNHNQWTVWELENAATLARSAKGRYGQLEVWDDIKDEATRPENYVSGKAAEHYRRYRDDFKLAKQLKLNAMRSGIEWSRIEPKVGQFNQRAIEHYRQYFTEMKQQGIEPILTLWHWTMPEWFADKGGFLKRANVKYFTRYVQYVMENIGVNFRYVITINEPTIYSAFSYYYKRWPPQHGSVLDTYLVMKNLARAHRRAHAIIKRFQPKAQIGLAHNCAYVYTDDDSWISSLSVRIAHYIGNKWFINQVKKQQDFLGLNYYLGHRIKGVRSANTNDKPLNDLGWRMEPELLGKLAEQLYSEYGLPILVTETGVADKNDTHRKWWIQNNLSSLALAEKRGAEILGYIHWSLLDNFEWAEGFWPRFGLIEVDYKTQARTIRPSAKWYATVIKQSRGDT